MLSEYSDIISDLKVKDARFASVFSKHDELDQKITDIEKGRYHMEHFELEALKKEKLRLKDEAYQIIQKYKNL